MSEFIASFLEVETIELDEDAVKIQDNFSLYSAIVEDPKAVIESVKSTMEEEGDEISGDHDEMTRSIVKKALENRHLSPAEEAREAETKAILEQTEEQVQGDSQMSKIQILAAVAFALIVLILAFKLGGDDD